MMDNKIREVGSMGSTSRWRSHDMWAKEESYWKWAISSAIDYGKVAGVKQRVYKKAGFGWVFSDVKEGNHSDES